MITILQIYERLFGAEGAHGEISMKPILCSFAASGYVVISRHLEATKSKVITQLRYSKTRYLSGNPASKLTN